MVLANLWMLAALAPLHQPYNLASIEAARAAFPDVPQIACFDTAFHRGHDFVNDAYALPLGYYQRGMRRYGFHGLSYEFILRQMHEIDPVQSNGRIIMAHLSSGASLCAIKEGRSVASTMGFTTLDGLPMATRCGQIDPGLLLYLLEHDKMSVADLSRLLYEQSGLKGLSGVSSDISVLETSHSEHAKMAIDYFVHRIRTEIGGLAAILGGLDSLVFSGAVGEVSARIREAVLRDMEWLGVTLDTEANANNALRISTGPTKVFVIPTDQEMMIAHHVIKTARLGVSAV
jgi:acetate kinase